MSLLCSVILVACSSSTTETGSGGGTTGSGGAGSGGAASGGGGASSGAGGGCASPVTFTEVKSTVLVGCGGYTSCHTSGLFGGGLDLTPEHAYANLVGVTSTQGQGKLLVTPGDPGASFLYDKVTNDLPADGSLGGPMPKTGTAQGWAPLSAEQIEAVRCWIAGGAADN